MPRTKRDVAELKKRAVYSLVLAIELFNRPHEQGRAEGVLILLHHSFEMLLKAIIKDRTGIVHDKEEKYSYRFNQCLEVAQNEIKILSRNDRSFLSILDAHRDTAIHFYQEVSEDLLYIQAQGAVTLLSDLLDKAFKERLGDMMPERVLPISTRPPKDLQLLLGNELSQIDEMLKPGSRKSPQAIARLRPIMALATASRDKPERLTEKELRKAVSRRRGGEEWPVVFPEVAHLRLDTEGEGNSLSVRIENDADLAMRLPKPGEVSTGVLFKQEINIWDKYNLGRDDLAEKLQLTGPKTSALIRELGIQEDTECFRLLKRKSTTIKGYSKKALDRLRQELADGLDVDAVWQRQRHHFGTRRRRGTDR